MSVDAPLETLQYLSESITTLQETLDPLLALPLHETLSQLDAVQNAKLDVSLAFTIHNLIWMYLKCKGMNTKDHPVTRELERLKKYFGKIKDAEDNSKRSLQVDKAAAGRFIRAALSAAAAAQVEEAGNAPQPQPSEIGTHTRFQWVAPEASRLVRDEVVMKDGEEDSDVAEASEESEVDFVGERNLKIDKAAAGRFIMAAIRSSERAPKIAGSSSRPNEGLEEGEVDSEIEILNEAPVAVGNGKSVERTPQPPKRRGMDPFAGYDVGQSGESPRKKRKKKGKGVAVPQ